MWTDTKITKFWLLLIRHTTGFKRTWPKFSKTSNTMNKLPMLHFSQGNCDKLCLKRDYRRGHRLFSTSNKKHTQ